MKPAYQHGGVVIYQGDARMILAELSDESVNCCVTSPPYWGLRDYGVEGQIGLEQTPEQYIVEMVGVFCEVKRVLRADGTLWLNIGDSYCASGGNTRGASSDGEVGRAWNGANSKSGEGLKQKDLVGIPWMLAFALRADGWYLRSDIIWSKPNPMPESVTDRPTKAHEYIFLLSKSERYFYDASAIAEAVSPASLKRWDQEIDSQIGSDRVPGKTNGNMRAVGGPRVHGNIAGRSDGGAACNKPDQFTRNKRTVWEVATQPFPEAHFATFPEELIKPCILAGCPAGGTVLDPFIGSGTTGLVARENHCRAIGIELNAEYIEIAKRRLAQDVLQFA